MRTRLLLPLLIGAGLGAGGFDQLLFAGHGTCRWDRINRWWGVMTAPFSHAGFGHLISNSLAFLPLSWLVLSRGVRSYLNVWIWCPGDDHSGRIAVAKSEPWPVGRGLRIAGLPDRDRMGGTSALADPAQRCCPVVLRTNIGDPDPGCLTSMA